MQLDYDERYTVDDSGAVINRKTGYTIKPIIDSEGYMKITLFKGDGKRIQKYVHRMVAELFVPIPKEYESEKKLCVYHKDRNKFNNRAENLEWKPFGKIISDLHEDKVYDSHLDSLKTKILMINPNDEFRETEFESLIESAIYLKSTDPENLPSVLSVRANIASALDSNKTKTAYGMIWKRK